MTVVDERVSCRGRRVLFESAVERLPNGATVRVDRVVFPESVAVLPLDLGGCRVLLIRQYRPSVGKWLYEAPAGVVDPGEAPEEAAVRELEEEAGLGGSRLVRVGGGYVAPGYSTERMTLFLALDVKEVGARPEEHEVIVERKWISIDEALSMVREGAIEDVKTVALIYSATVFCRHGTA